MNILSKVSIQFMPLPVVALAGYAPLALAAAPILFYTVAPAGAATASVAEAVRIYSIQTSRRAKERTMKLKVEKNGVLLLMKSHPRTPYPMGTWKPISSTN